MFKTLDRSEEIEDIQVELTVAWGPMFPILKAEIVKVSGYASPGGILQGPALIRLRNGVQVWTKLKDGVMHGLTHSYRVRFTLPFAKEYQERKYFLYNYQFIELVSINCRLRISMTLTSPGTTRTSAWSPTSGTAAPRGSRGRG